MANPIEPTPPLSPDAFVALLAEMHANGLDEVAHVQRAAKHLLATSSPGAIRVTIERETSVPATWMVTMPDGSVAWGVTPGAALDMALLGMRDTEAES